MPETSLYAVHMIARGRVQGVGFRFFVRDEASLFGINGWVRNLEDGSVEIHGEGTKERLDEFISKVNMGPRSGLVSDLDVDWVEPANDYTSFRIEF
jgi:acylphosphatase